jgi:hypothetical protein
MIKIFTTNNEILDVNSNSNQYGWMMIVTYKIVR